MLLPPHLHNNKNSLLTVTFTMKPLHLRLLP